MRRRILIAIVGVAASAVFLLALPLGVAVQRLYREDEILKLERNATAQARGVDPSAAQNDPVEFSPATAGDEIAAYSVKGELLGGQGPAQADSLVEETLTSGKVAEAEDAGRLEVSVPVLGGERVVGAIRATRSTDELDERVGRARLLIGAVAIVIVALAALAALALSRRLSRPLADLADAARAASDRRPSVGATRSGIDELDVVAEALDAMARRLNGLLDRERAFSADASHQLKTPLAALRLDLEARELNGEEIGETLIQVERLERTIDTLLAAARDEPSDRQSFGLGEMLDEVRQRWVGPFAELGRSLAAEASRGGDQAVASRTVVEEILDVLLDNAMRHGGGTVRVSCRPIGGQLAVDVSDEGPGIDDAENLFSRREGSDHGIGLALARSLAEGEGGRLDLTESRSGRTTFTLLLRAEAHQSPDRTSGDW